MSCNTALTLSFLIVVLLLSHTSLSMSPFHNLGGLEAQRIQVDSNAIIDLEDPDRLAKRNVNAEGYETYQTSVPEPKRGPTYDSEESSPPEVGSIDWDLNGAGTAAYLVGSDITSVTGNLSVPALPNTIRRQYGQILYAGLYASSDNLTMTALLKYPTAPDGDYTGSAVWTYVGYVIAGDNSYFQTVSYPVVQGDVINADIRSNGRVHSVIGRVNGRQVFNFTVILTTTLTNVGVGTQVFVIGGCSELPSNHVQYFENINVKDNGVALTSYDWIIVDSPKVCNSTVVCCSNACLAYWNNPSTSLTCAQVRSLYGVKPTSSVTLPPRTTPTAASTATQPLTPTPTTTAPTSATVKPTTVNPTTAKPTTRKPTTRKPTPRKPTTRKPTTRKPTTRKPTTRKPTTAKPTSKA